MVSGDTCVCVCVRTTQKLKDKASQTAGGSEPSSHPLPGEDGDLEVL